ncbi:MAG: hypothetical protein ACLFWM_06415 [Actinomycetota bacterium]
MRSRCGLAVGVLVVMALAACQGEEVPAETTVPADLAPEEVVNQLLEAVLAGRFEETSALTDQRQAGLLALAEGADVNEVVQALDEDPGGVAANFWSGFAQTLDPSFTLEEASLEAGDTVRRDGESFVAVGVAGPEGEERVFYLRRDGTWRVDLMATFAPVVAERLTPRVESLLTSANPDASRVVGMLRRSIPSLRLAADDQGLEASVHQSLLALIERITRAG